MQRLSTYPSIKIKQYDILKDLKGGPMKQLCTQFGGKVAINTAEKRTKVKLKYEKTVIKAYHHENIVEIYGAKLDIADIKATFTIWMEL